MGGSFFSGWEVLREFMGGPAVFVSIISNSS